MKKFKPGDVIRYNGYSIFKTYHFFLLTEENWGIEYIYHDNRLEEIEDRAFKDYHLYTDIFTEDA